MGKINLKLQLSAINPPKYAAKPERPNIKKKFKPKTTDLILNGVISLIMELING